MGKRVAVIGAGFGGLTAAALLAHQGHSVTVYEKNDQPGGRARVWKKDGYTFDMGPSWYLMPDVFEKLFAQFGKTPAEYLDLERLDPSYRVYFGKGHHVDLAADLATNLELFDQYQEGGGAKLEEYLESARYQYRVAMDEFIYKEYHHFYDFLNRKLMLEGTKLHLFESLDRYARRFITDKNLRKILEYNIVFLGGTPYKSPALYALMSHVDFDMGVWYPAGGIGALGRAFETLATEQGVHFEYHQPVSKIEVDDGAVRAVHTPSGRHECDIVVANADYHHVETELLEREHRSYSDRYWRRRSIAPSALLMFLGVEKRVEGLQHHTLYFDPNWKEHFDTIFDKPAWPERPCYYVCTPSKTDPAVAPDGCENLFILVPVAPALEDTDATRERYYDLVLDHLEGLVGTSIRDAVRVKRLFAHRDFVNDYNSYRGTALGLAHTLRQTAIFRPKHASKKVDGLYYSGHYNHPGIGVPMVIISSQILAEQLRDDHD